MPPYKRTYKRQGRADRIVWCYKFEESGKPHVKCGFETKKQAQNAELQKRRERHSKCLRPVAMEDVAFEHFIPTFLQHRVLTHAVGTLKRDTRRIRPAEDYFRGRNLDSISRGNVLDYRDGRISRGLANRTITVFTPARSNLIRSFWLRSVTFFCCLAFHTFCSAHVIKNQLAAR